MQNPTPVLENNTQKLLWDVDMHTDPQSRSEETDLIIINKKKKRICKIVDFAVPADHRIKLKEYARELKKTVYHEGDNYTNCDWSFWYSNLRITKGTR